MCQLLSGAGMKWTHRSTLSVCGNSNDVIVTSSIGERTCWCVGRHIWERQCIRNLGR